MKLSEAIRLGAMMKPQGFFVTFGDNVTCALGGAVEAAGLQRRRVEVRDETSVRGAANPGDFVIDIPQEWLPVTGGSRFCPACQDLVLFTVAHLIPHLNDPPHSWTREQIADYIEGVEREIESNARKEEPEGLITA